jgi:mono/diheme cytochrome c family protein
MRLLIASLACAAIAAAANTSPAPITFQKNVLPVLQKNCQGCHRPGEAAPMSFLTYDSTRPWAKAIKQAVVTKKMPPWFADPHYGKFGNDRTLSQSEIDTLVAWADSGAREGDRRDAPKALAFVEGWQMGKPDMVIEMPTAFEVPASGTIDYQYVVIPSGLTEDRYVQMAEARPGNNALVHHIIAFIREPGNPWLKDAPKGVAFAPRRNGGNGGAALGDSLAGYAPGVTPKIMQPGQAKMIKAGSDIVLQMHYTANGTAGTDKSRVGIVFSKEKPTERVLSIAAATMNFVIPAGDPNYEVYAKLTLQADSTLVSLLPHMHFRGKDFIYRATYPTGEKEVLLSVPHYDFNWQLTYDLAQPKVLPKGTLIECTAHFDNSANNKNNPDPTKEVRFGEQTWEEMMFGFFDVAVPINVSARDLMMPKPKPAPASSGSGQ